jgi:hypothetical protein
MTRNIVLGAAAVLMLAVAAWMFWGYATSSDALPSTFTLDGICLACKKEAHVAIQAGEREPCVCPTCGERAVYGWQHCSECGFRFIPELVPAADGGPPRVPPIATCANCGSSATGAYFPQDPPVQVKGDAPLPPWPP